MAFFGFLQFIGSVDSVGSAGGWRCALMDAVQRKFAVRGHVAQPAVILQDAHLANSRTTKERNRTQSAVSPIP